MKNAIFTTKLQQEKADFIMNNKDCRLSKMQGFQLQDIAIQWSYYSGKIEGSTYSLVQTESLIKDNVVKGMYSEAVMHKNMYNTLIQEMDYIKHNTKELIEDKLVFRLHKGLTKGLVSDEDNGKIRRNPVGVKGTTYIPSKNYQEILMKFSTILYEQQFFQGIEKAIYLHCNLSRLQAFIDGNKRTSRMVESVVLMNNDLLPTFTINSNSILDYREAIVEFYETQDYTAYTNFMLDKQIELVEQLSKEKFLTQQNHIEDIEEEETPKRRFRR